MAKNTKDNEPRIYNIYELIEISVRYELNKLKEKEIHTLEPQDQFNTTTRKAEF